MVEDVYEHENHTIELTQLGTSEENIDFNFSPSTLETKNLARKEIISEWPRRWDSNERERWTNVFFDNVKEDRLQGGFYRNQIFSGHGMFSTHQAKLFGKSSFCFCGLAYGTIDHVLRECLLWWHLRKSWSADWAKRELKDLMLNSNFRSLLDYVNII
ncbi:hypothetical protein AVEN_166230-1 [Araneus ventricosus]|uniref:Reverse transcriptase zinc-binding domain-containing protein n=1 Tax=Araneus ventricosus TaxID=182803 RepID=A0A4Y2FRI2_ARAVE|nr:hypothetical protein AVEN_166230-1 [Araneus ventricosus]